MLRVCQNKTFAPILLLPMKPKKGLYILISIAFFLILSYSYKDNIFKQRFVDEEENFANGKYLLKGEKLYDDILTSHQPLAYVFSYSVQNISHPRDVYFLIKNHRLAVLFWSAAWSIILVSLFGLPALLFVVIFELSKNFIFGNLFLPEALVSYPLVFLAGSILRNKFDELQALFFGFTICLSAFLLQPIWPLLLLLVLFFVFQLRRKKKLLLFAAIGAVLIILVTVSFISFPGYIKTLFLNLTYTIPNYQASYYKESWLMTLLKSYISPILTFFYTKFGAISIILKVVSMLFFINIIFLFATKNYKLAITTILLLGLANLHFVYPGNESYATGFLPWYSLYIFISLFLAVNQLKTKIRLVNILLMIVMIFTCIKLGGEVLFKKGDLQKDYFVNFSTFEDRGRAIAIMSKSGDTLLVSPDNWLIYWSSGVNHLPKLMGYYAWMAGIPKINQRINAAFETNPPTFIYCENCYGSSLEKYLIKYKEIKKDEGNTFLYILSGKQNSLTQQQIADLKSYHFSF